MQASADEHVWHSCATAGVDKSKAIIVPRTFMACRPSGTSAAVSFSPANRAFRPLGRGDLGQQSRDGRHTRDPAKSECAYTPVKGLPRIGSAHVHGAEQLDILADPCRRRGLPSYGHSLRTGG